MYTVYLVRDPKGKPPCYLSFVADAKEAIVAQTAFGSEKYSEVLLHASILFKFYWERYGTVASFMESPFDSQSITCYSVNEFRVKKTADHFVYANLIDQYQSLLSRVSSSEALRIIHQEHKITPEQRSKLLWFLRMKPHE
jgi:hypothetical protein